VNIIGAIDIIVGVIVASFDGYSNLGEPTRDRAVAWRADRGAPSASNSLP
jgi:hypothetical protein